MKKGLTALVVATLIATVHAGGVAASPQQPPAGTPVTVSQGTPDGGWAASAGPKQGTTLDTRFLRGMKSKDHTVAVKKIKIRLVSAPSKTVWTSTSRTVDVPMTFDITDPERVAKKIRICPEVVDSGDYSCKDQKLKNYRKPQGDFAMSKTKTGWRIYTAPYYKGVSPADCIRWEYYRPKVRWHVWVVDPRDDEDLVSARFGWTVRCSG